MPLIQRLVADHTIREFRAAALMRFREARRLALAGDRLAAVYFGGYAVEMSLKAAYFRLTGWGLHDPITLADIQAAKQHAKSTLACYGPATFMTSPRGQRCLSKSASTSERPMV